MASFSEYTREYKKKKKKDAEIAPAKGQSFADYTKSVLGTSDIAPVRTTTSEEKSDTYLQKSSFFDDGYQFGDVIKTVGATLGDIGENIVKGTANFGEKVWDGMLFLGAMATDQQMMQAGLAEAGAKKIAGKDEEAEAAYKKYMDTGDEVKKETAEYVAKDIIQEDKIDFGVDEYSVLGEKSDALVQSATEVSAREAVKLIPVVGVPLAYGTTAFSVMGGEAEYALNNGATYEEAFLSGVISAAAEIGTEAISGGIKIGGKTLTDAAVSKIASTIKSKALGTLAKWGVNSLLEGGEEVASGFFSALGQKLTYADEKEFNELFSKEDAWDNFVGGVILGGFFDGINIATANARGVDYVTGLKQNEKKVVDKVYKDAVAEEEKSKGRKLTTKEKTKIFDRVVAQVQRGYISTDTIEEVLDGENYKVYQEALAEEEALQKEYDELRNMKNGEKSDVQIDRQADLKMRLEELKEFKKNYKSDAYNRFKGSKLGESYRDTVRRQQKFTADVNQYEGEYARKTVQNAIDSGFMNNGNEAHDFVDYCAKLAEERCYEVVFTDSKGIADMKAEYDLIGDTSRVEGFNSGKRKKIYVNMEANKSWASIVGHEVTDTIREAGHYEALRDAAKAYAEAKGDYASKLDSVKRRYKNVDADIEGEVTSDIVGEYLNSEDGYDFVKHLYTNNRNVFEWLWDEIKYLCRFATAGSKEARALEKMKHNFEKVMRESKNADSKASQKADARVSEDGFVGSYSGTKYNATQSKLLADVSLEGIQNATDLAGRQDILFNHIGISDAETKKAWLDNGLAYMETNADGDSYAVVNEAVLMDERERRQRNAKSKAGVNYSMALDKYSQKQYNDFGWARDADAISKNELDDMYSKIHEKGSLKKFAQSSSGEAIIEVNDNPNTTLGADNVFVFVTGTKNNPQINKVVRFQVETDTEMEIIKEKLYERGSFSNTYYSFLRQEGLAREYSKKSSLDYNEYAQKVRRGSRGADSNRAYGNRGSEQNGTRASGETRSNEIAPINETSSKDGVFFDGEKVNYSLSNSEARLSLSEDPIAPTREGDQNEAMRYNAPVVEDVAPVNETRGSKAEKVVPTAEVYTDDFAPVENLYTVEQEIDRLMTEDAKEASKEYDRLIAEGKTDEAQALLNSHQERLNTLNEKYNSLKAEEKAQFDSLDDADAPPEMEAPYYGENETVEPEDPFEKRDIKEVGNRKVKAYMYENPEVKPFFQEEANYLLGELGRTVKGERTYTETPDGRPGAYGSDSYGHWIGVKRQTTPDIAYLLDTLGYTYAEIEMGIKAIIEDNGAENNACSKRIEFLLNDRLMNGYVDEYGYDVPANQDYINLLKEKSITEYNEEARKSFFESIDDLVPPADDIAPVADKEVSPAKEMKISKTAEDIAPVDTYETRKAGQVEGQQTMFDEGEEQRRPSRKELHRSIIDRIKAKFTERGSDLDETLKNAKNLSTFATVDNTPQRVMEKSLGYKEGRILADETVNKVAQNETEGIKWLNSFTDRKNGLLAKISKQYKIKPGSKESAAAQMYAEGFYVDENNNLVKYGDEELEKDFPSAKTQANIKGLAGDTRIRQIYDETLKAINESRARNAYPEIPRLENYFLHFRAMEDTFSRLGLPFNPNDIRAKDLPTDLNGVTADLKPGQPYFSSAIHRRGNRTSFDLLGGLERYLSSAKNQIYHIDDIQTLRALRNYIADAYGQANGLEGLDELSEEEAQERIKQVYGSHLSTFAKFLNEEANIIAGKTALIDRGLEGIIGRRGITFLDNVNKQVGANMVGFNVSSSLTNFLAGVQAIAKTNKLACVKALAQTTSSKIGSIFGKTDSFVENNPTIIRRNGADRFYRTPYQKVADAGYTLMSAVDNVTTEFIVRAKYNEFINKGMSEEQAILEADKWTSRLMGDRSLGQMPQLYNSKMLGMVTKFQLEVRNQLDSQFYDTYQEAKASNENIKNGLERNAKTAAKVTATLFELAVLQHLFGKAFESVAGYNPAFDIIDILIKTLGLDDEDDEDTVLDNVEEGFLALLEDLPYTSTLTGGRIPISSALPIEQLIKGEDEYGNEKSRLETIGEVAPYYVLPGGYGQLKKTYQGLSMFSDEHPIPGSYTDSGNLRFPVEDTFGNRVQAAIFGQWASRNARDYFDNDITPLKDKQIQEFIDVGIPIQDYWKYREGLSGLDKLAEKADYIDSLDLSDRQKNILINNIANRKVDIDMSNYGEYKSFEEFDFAAKNPEKYAFAKSVGGYEAYKKYSDELYDIKEDKDSSGKTISGSRKEKVIEYVNNLNADYGTKIILFKREYPSDDTYNYEIVEYLNSREDISYDEMETILKELGFTVDSKGNIYW